MAKKVLAKTSLPFPYGERDAERDRQLFGEAGRTVFKFETMASEFETSDEWNDSGLGEYKHCNNLDIFNFVNNCNLKVFKCFKRL